MVYFSNAVTLRYLLQKPKVREVQWTCGMVHRSNTLLIMMSKAKIVHHGCCNISQLQWHYLVQWTCGTVKKLVYYWSWAKQILYIMHVAIFVNCTDITSATLEATSSASAVDMWYVVHKVACNWVTQINCTPCLLLYLSVAATQSQLLWRPTVLQVQWTHLTFFLESGKGPSRCLS